jgi:hypothetical protein
MSYQLEVGDWVRVCYRRDKIPDEELPYGRIYAIKKKRNWQITYNTPAWNIRYCVEFLDGKKFRKATYSRGGLMPCDEPAGEAFALWAVGKWKE